MTQIPEVRHLETKFFFPLSFQKKKAKTSCGIQVNIETVKVCFLQNSKQNNKT